jgi:hypothetical protein
MRLAIMAKNKAYMTVTLGAAIELKEQVAKPCTSAAKRGVSLLAGRSVSASKGGGGGRASEESLRMVMYLCCWGPSLSCHADMSPVRGN